MATRSRPLGTLLLFTTLAAAGCSGVDRYTLHEADNTHTSYYKLDGLMGTVELIQGGTVSPVQKPASADPSLALLKDWGSQAIPGRGIKVETKTKWRDGLMLYRVTLTPPDSVQAYRVTGSVWLIPYDKDTFELDRVKIDFSEAKRVVDAGGRPVSFEAVGSWAMEAGSYRSITAVGLSWLLP